MEKTIIAFTGKANSGKDTAGCIINYVAKVGIARANYQEWSKLYNSGKLNNNFHFADNVKRCLSIIYGIPVDCFHDRNYKDNMYYSLLEHRFIERDKLDKRFYSVIDIKDLKVFTIKEALCEVDRANKRGVVTLRTLLQYFATEVCRVQLHEDIWTDSTISEIWRYLEGINNVACITDLRFLSELEKIKRLSIKVVSVKINRPDKEMQFDHASEKINFDTDFVIENNSTLMGYFYKILRLFQDIKKYGNNN